MSLPNQSRAIDHRMVSLARDAEADLRKSPLACMTRLRAWSEALARKLAEEGNLPPADDQASLLAAIEKAGLADRNALSRFHRIRIEGNKAVHEGKATTEIAKSCMESAEELAGWFLRTREARLQRGSVSAAAGLSLAFRILWFLACLGAAAAPYGISVFNDPDAPLFDGERPLYAGHAAVQIVLALFFCRGLFGTRSAWRAPRFAAAFGMAGGPATALWIMYGPETEPWGVPAWGWLVTIVAVQLVLLAGIRSAIATRNPKPRQPPPAQLAPTPAAPRRLDVRA